MVGQHDGGNVGRAVRQQTQAAIVVMDDRADVLGRAVEQDAAVPLASVGRAVAEALPGHAVFVMQTSTTAASVGRAPRARARRAVALTSAFHTDARRLLDLRAERFAHVVVVRPHAAGRPAALEQVLRAAVRSGADLLTVDGVSPLACYVASRAALALLAPLGAIPGAVTLPDACARLFGFAGPSAVPLRIVSVPPAEAGWVGGSEVDWPATSRTRPAGACAAADARSAHREVLVVLPSPYQSGAHFAWLALLEALDPGHVAFLVARGSVLAEHLGRLGYVTCQVDAHGGRPAATVLAEALSTTQPAVVHVDGADAIPLLPAIRASGARVVQHVRLNAVDRFAPGFAQADAVVAVSPHLQRLVVERVGERVPVVHIADGVRLATAPEAAVPPATPWSGAARPLRCLCVGRVEPAKDQLRVLDIIGALSAHIACDLRLVGPCGADAAYADAVVDRLRNMPPAAAGSWQPFGYPMDAHYGWADVVIVASRNEALGMVGLEALAAGRLLVAQRSTGYETIVDAGAGEGLLFDRDDTPGDVAARILEALRSGSAFAERGRRKAETHFDARRCAQRLEDLWQSLR